MVPFDLLSSGHFPDLVFVIPGGWVTVTIVSRWDWLLDTVLLTGTSVFYDFHDSRHQWVRGIEVSQMVKLLGFMPVIVILTDETH